MDRRPCCGPAGRQSSFDRPMIMESVKGPDLRSAIGRLPMPRRWDMGMVQRFKFGLGPISSVYDFLTFGVML